MGAGEQGSPRPRGAPRELAGADKDVLLRQRSAPVCPERSIKSASCHRADLTHWRSTGARGGAPSSARRSGAGGALCGAQPRAHQPAEGTPDEQLPLALSSGRF